MNSITISNPDTIKKNENYKSINERFYEGNNTKTNSSISPGI